MSGDSGMSTVFSSIRFSIFFVTTFWRISVFCLLGAREVGDAVAGRRPRHPRHGVVAEAAGRRDVLVAVVLVEAAGQVADDLAVLRRHQDDVELLILAVAGGDGHQVAGGRGLDRDDHDVRRLAALRREVLAVVGRALLVAERLEAILQVLVELLVELLGLQPERFFVGALAAADDGLAQREEELPQPFLAPASIR